MNTNGVAILEENWLFNSTFVISYVQKNVAAKNKHIYLSPSDNIYLPEGAEAAAAGSIPE